jgi:hypothetical protein
MRFVLVADPDVNDVVVAEQDIAGVMSMGVKRTARCRIWRTFSMLL